MVFGSTIGRRPFYAVEGTTHHCNLYSVLVGKTAQSRKGTSWGRAQQVFNTIQERPPIKGGLSSGEGLVDAVHDDIQKWVPGKRTPLVISSSRSRPLRTRGFMCRRANSAASSW